MLITEDRLQKSLTYIAETDEQHATAKALMKGLEKQEKTVKAKLFIEANGKGGVAEREAIVYASPEYKEWIGKYEDSIVDYEILNNKRLREILIIDVWRSLNSSRNKGNIV